MTNRSALHYDALVEAAGGLADSHCWLIKHVPPGSTVLECGSAGGYVVKALRERGCTVDGVDIDPDAAARAAPLCRTFHVGSLDDLTFLASLSGSYDRILFGDVLEHLVEPERALRAAAGLVGAEGRVLISIPNVAHWRLRWALLRGRFEYQDSGLLDRTHLRFFTYQGAAELVERAGYAIVDHTFTDGPPPFAGWRYLYPLLKRFPNLTAFQTLIEAVPVGRRGAL